MINVFFFSIAGKKSNNVVSSLLEDLLSSPYTPEQDKKIIQHSLDVAEKGNYPSKEYYSTFYPTPEFTYASIAELAKFVSDVLDFFKMQFLNKSVIKTLNESNTSKELLEKLSDLTASVPEESVDSDDFAPTLLGDSINVPFEKGLTTCVPEFDSVTAGLQGGNVATIAAFTSHGKSTYSVSFIFKNIIEGKKGVLLSLEMAPQLIWQQFEARYMYEVKGLQVTTQDIREKKLPKDTLSKVLEYEKDFKEEFCSNLIIVDESWISKSIMLDYKKFSKKIKLLEDRLGAMDFVVHDHVGQYELMFEECGNRIIKSIQSFTKTYVDRKGNRPVTLMAVQCNREGEKRARKRGGVYDIQAISDLNEVERTSGYIMFMYTSEEMKVVQETKMTLHKNRLGSTLTEPVTVSFNPQISTIGSSVEKVDLSDDDFASLGVDFGSFDDDF